MYFIYISCLTGSESETYNFDKRSLLKRGRSTYIYTIHQTYIYMELSTKDKNI